MKNIRLYRWCTALDEQNRYKISSRETEELSVTRSIEEIISHELNAATGRGVIYSFSTSLELVKAYSKKNPQGTGLMYIDLDLDALPDSVIALYPLYDRDCFMRLLASDPKTVKKGYVTNPATKRNHSFVGILNYSERSVSGWSRSMSEVMIQCDSLQLKPIEEINAVITPHETEENLKLYMKENFTVANDDITAFRECIVKTFEKVPLKNQNLLNRVRQNEWCA